LPERLFHMEETLILAHLMTNDEYLRQVIPHLDPALFSDPVQRKLFVCAKDYFVQYGKMATKEAVQVAFGKIDNGMNDEQHEEGEHILAPLTLIRTQTLNI
jgi:hypothetical protein